MGDALPFVSLGAGQRASKLALGMFHTCALLTDGVKCWGCALPRSSAPRTPTQLTDSQWNGALIIPRYNGDGMLGLGDAVHRGVAAAKQMGDALPFIRFGATQTTASALVVGAYHTCVLLKGSVKCWGCAVSLGPVSLVVLHCRAPLDFKS